MKSFFREVQALLSQMGNGLAAQHLGEMAPRKQKSAELEPVLPVQLVEPCQGQVEEPAHDSETIADPAQIPALSAV